MVAHRGYDIRLIVWCIAGMVWLLRVVGVVLEGRVLIVIEGRILILGVWLIGRGVIGVVLSWWGWGWRLCVG